MWKTRSFCVLLGMISTWVGRVICLLLELICSGVASHLSLKRKIDTVGYYQEEGIWQHVSWGLGKRTEATELLGETFLNLKEGRINTLLFMCLGIRVGNIWGSGGWGHEKVSWLSPSLFLKEPFHWLRGWLIPANYLPPSPLSTILIKI